MTIGKNGIRTLGFFMCRLIIEKTSKDSEEKKDGFGWLCNDIIDYEFQSIDTIYEIMDND
jgi:hypothetical protein